MIERKTHTVLTIGHSTRSLPELVELLHGSHVTLLVDIRSIPRSRTNPQFNSNALAERLPEQGVSYIHMASLGGLRHPKANSSNTVWRNASFRGYADYMETGEFREAIDELLELAKKDTVAIMCSEAVWWRCHRSMVADELVARGVTVEHIMGKDRKPHKLRSFAHAAAGHVSYHPGRSRHGSADT